MDTKIKTVKLLRISLIILYFRAINSNPLNCDCEMRAFRQSIYARQGNLLVMSATCAGTAIKMTDAQDSQFGSCTGMYDMQYRGAMLTYDCSGTGQYTFTRLTRPNHCFHFQNRTQMIESDLRLTIARRLSLVEQELTVRPEDRCVLSVVVACSCCWISSLLCSSSVFMLLNF